LATYLAEQWNTRLTVFTALENKKLTAIIQNEARDYLEFHEIEANYLIEPGANDSLDQVIEEHGIDLLLMGAYSGSALKEVFTGSTVNWMLRNTKIPILICK
jgi:nucleotide-binding universal stress UspA family protein